MAEHIQCYILLLPLLSLYALAINNKYNIYAFNLRNFHILLIYVTFPFLSVKKKKKKEDDEFEVRAKRKKMITPKKKEELNTLDM